MNSSLVLPWIDCFNFGQSQRFHAKIFSVTKVGQVGVCSGSNILLAAQVFKAVFKAIHERVFSFSHKWFLHSVIKCNLLSYRTVQMNSMATIFSLLSQLTLAQTYWTFHTIYKQKDLCNLWSRDDNSLTILSNGGFNNKKTTENAAPYRESCKCFPWDIVNMCFFFSLSFNVHCHCFTEGLLY